MTNVNRLFRAGSRTWVLFLLAMTALTDFTGAALQNYDAFFPIIVSGQSGDVTLETAVVITNPGPEAVQVTVDPIRTEFEGPRSFSLAARKTTVLFFRGHQAGAGRVSANAPIAASSYIIVRLAANPLKIIADVTAPGQPLTSKAVVPVFVGTTLADNTAIALLYRQAGCYRFTLYNAEGVETGMRTEASGFNLGRPVAESVAMFVTELFPSLAPGFIGSLVVEHVAPANIGQAFALSALYSSDQRLSTANVTPMDTEAHYSVSVKPGNSAETAAQLAVQYGFTLAPEEAGVVGVMTHETARALARDPRVADVSARAAVFQPGTACVP